MPTESPETLSEPRRQLAPIPGTLDDFTNPEVFETIDFLLRATDNQAEFCLRQNPNPRELASLIVEKGDYSAKVIIALDRLRVPYHVIAATLRELQFSTKAAIGIMRTAGIQDSNITHALRTTKVSPAELITSFREADETLVAAA